MVRKKASYKITVKKKNIIFITASLGRRMDCWFNKYETSDGEIYKSKKRECEVEGEKLKAKGSNLAYNDDDSLFYVFRSGSPSSHQYSDADNIKSKEDDGKTEKKTPGLLKITKDMLKKIYSDKEERKYVELYVFFSLSGNGVKNETCEYIESPKNEMYKEYAIGYNNAINKLKAEGYSKVKGFVLSHAPLNTKHMIKDFNESKVVYSTNEKACNKNYRSGYKYVLSNRQMENAILVTKDKNDKKVSSNLTFVNFFDRIVTLDKAEDGMDKKTFTWKKNEDGKSYQKLVKTHDGLHWDKKTTKMMMPIILEEAGF